MRKLLLTLFAVALLVGCASMETNAYKTLNTTAVLVNTSLRAYGDWVSTEIVVIEKLRGDERAQRYADLTETNRRAREVYGNYQKAMAVAEVAVASAKNAPAGQADWKTAVNAAGAAAAEFISFVRTLTTK